jgi:hypothetical protein
LGQGQSAPPGAEANGAGERHVYPQELQEVAEQPLQELELLEDLEDGVDMKE